jgi:hypothetical protein
LNGKIKGLFCSLNKDFFYNFTVFGLHAQSVLGKAPSIQPALVRDVFRPPWSAAIETSDLALDNKDVAYLRKVSGFAAKRATTLTKPSQLRFSRFSANRDDLCTAGGTEEVFLALCRVLILHQRTIAEPIRDSDISEAIALNYDTLYSSSTYVTTFINVIG